MDEDYNIEDQYLNKEKNSDLREALQRIRKRVGNIGWDVIQERLSQDAPETLETIGKRWGVSRERVRQVEIKTKIFLSHYLEPLAAA